MSEADYSEINNLEPDHFEWLNLAEEFFKYEKGEDFKYGVERNIPERNSTFYDSIEEEWEQLNEMYEANPEKTVKPLMPVYAERDGERKMIGFYLERVDGQDMYDTLKELKDWRSGLKMAERIEDVVREFHEEGLVHGDLANNIIINSEGFKLYDPVGVPRTDDDYRTMKNLDEDGVKRLKEAAKAPFGDAVDDGSIR